MNYSERKTIVLWGTPRSVSTAFEKTFVERQDIAVVHEPFAECYYYSRWRKSCRYGDNTALRDYGANAAIERVFATSSSATFVKDMAFQAVHYVPDEFLKKVINTFIIRDPVRVAKSLYSLKPDFTEEEFGFLSLKTLFYRVLDQTGQPTIVVDGDRFRNDPKSILRSYCSAVGVEFLSQMLKWQNGKIREWSSEEHEAHAKWHKTLEASREILAPQEIGDFCPRPEHEDVIGRAQEIYREIAELSL